MKISNFGNSSLWLTSFRPFFLLGALHGCLAVGIWLGILLEVWVSPFRINSIHWHSFEMVFGFSRAIVLGFLFTASQNWTGQIIARGKSLAVLTGLWAIGRLGFYDMNEPGLDWIFWGAGFACDLYAIYLIFPKLWQDGQEHNRIVLYNYGIFALWHFLAATSIMLSWDSGHTLHFIHLGVFSVVVFLVIIAGRIIPFFTGVVVSNYGNVRSEAVENIMIHLSFLFYAMEVIAYWVSDLTMMAGFYSVFYGCVSFYRFVKWKPWVSASVPILWVLHIGYFWLSLGLVLNGFSHFRLFPISSAYHVLTIGAIGVFGFGMMTRVSLGHTGRRIWASREMVLSYILLNIAVVSRVFLPLFGMGREGYTVSGGFWVIAFVLFLVQYTPILVAPRPDGRET